MKKIIIKIGAFIILSVILSANLQAFALKNPNESCTGGEPAIKNSKQYFGGTQCIGEALTKDKTNIITIVEEPLDTRNDTELAPTEAKPFIVKSCVRNTIVCTVTEGEGDKQKTKRISAAELLTTCSDNASSCNDVMVIISKAGPDMIMGYISMIYTWAASFVGLIAVAVIIISGIQISLSGGDSQAVTNSKDRILKSLAGLAVLFLSGLILYTINPTFFTFTAQ